MKGRATATEIVPRPIVQPTVPTRTCVGCRCAVPAVELLSVTFADGQLHWGPRQQRMGRGAWIHPVEVCLMAAAKNHGFARAFRTSISGVGVECVDSLMKQIQIASGSQQRRNG
jgi:predicted RNA-binding protein YlxR (DUF448 family)